MALPTRPAVGVVGLGLLGSALAKRLTSAGYRVVAFDLDRGRAAAQGHAVASAAEVASRADRVVLSLPDHTVVEKVVLGGAGLLSARRAPTTIVDTTTGDPESAVRLAERLTAEGVYFVEAAVSGSSRDVAQSDGVLLVGATRDALEAGRDLLEVLAPVVFHLGDVGSGSRAKLVTNLILGLQRLALAEGLCLAERVGLSSAALLELVRAGPAYSRIVDTKGPKMLHGDFTPQARLAQHKKDVDLILEMGRRAGAALPLSRKHAEVLLRALDAGHGEEDNSVVVEVLREMAAAGEEVPGAREPGD